VIFRVLAGARFGKITHYGHSLRCHTPLSDDSYARSEQLTPA